MKFYYICQLGYWLHALPELYFQKTKKVCVCVWWAHHLETLLLTYCSLCVHPEAISCLTSLVRLHCFK